VPVPRVSLRTAFVGAAVTVAAIHLVIVTLAALPPNRYSDVVTPHTGYLQPYFTQNWRLFAPNPVAEDRSVLFQGSYTAADGTTRETPWVDWTEVELDLVRHRLVGGRAGYITNKMFPSLQSRFAGLGSKARASVTTTDRDDPSSWAALDRRLRQDGARPAAVVGFLRYERAVVRLGTDVMEARWPDRTFVSVRYRLRRQGVVPYAARAGSESQRDAARPSPVERTSGWREPAPGPAAERRAVREFDRRHR
jgi:hypothetical protein